MDWWNVLEKNVVLQQHQRFGEKSWDTLAKIHNYSYIDDCKGELIQCKHIISELRSQLEQARMENENIEKDKVTLGDQLKQQHLHLSRQREKLIEAGKVAEEAERSNCKRSKEQYLLELENQT